MAGAAAHAMMPLTAVPTAGIGLMLTGLAHAVGWPVVAGGSARITDALAAALREHGRQHRDRPLGGLAGRASPGQGGPARRLAENAGPAGRRPAARPVPRRAAPVPLRPRRLQGGLRAVRTGAVGQRGLPPGRHPAPGRHVRAGRRGRGRGGGGQAPRRPLRPGGPARRGRPVPRPGRRGDAVGLLPRAVRLGRRHDQPDRGADRAVRPRLPRPHPGPRRADRRRRGGGQPELRRRRHRRRRADAAADRAAPGGPVEPVPDTGPRRLPVLLGHPADPGRARPLRRTGRADRAPRHLRHPRPPRHRPEAPRSRPWETNEDGARPAEPGELTWPSP